MFSPVICNVRVLNMYSEATKKDTDIAEYDKAMCEILGIEFTGTEFDWDW